MARKTYHHIARLYDILDLPFEALRYRSLRPQLFSGLSGRLLDAGVGTGRNMSYYPPGNDVIGIDLSRAMLARAIRRRRRLDGDAGLVEMNVLRLAFPDRSFDGIVASFLFCVLEPSDQQPALSELARVCRPGGEVRILEYAYPANPWARSIMRLWAPWVRFAYGAAFDRDTESHIAGAGFELVERRYLFRDIIKLLVLEPSS